MTNTDKQLKILFKRHYKNTIVRTVTLTEEAIRKLVPKGCYCYDAGGKCPFWSIHEVYPEQMNGYCSLLERGDWTHGASASSELWDACKNCGINDDDETLYEPPPERQS